MPASTLVEQRFSLLDGDLVVVTFLFGLRFDIVAVVNLKLNLSAGEAGNTLLEVDIGHLGQDWVNHKSKMHSTAMIVVSTQVHQSSDDSHLRAHDPGHRIVGKKHDLADVLCRFLHFGSLDTVGNQDTEEQQDHGHVSESQEVWRSFRSILGTEVDDVHGKGSEDLPLVSQASEWEGREHYR